jgi:hypothetical protein
MPNHLSLSTNKALNGAEVRALRIALARELVLQSHLEQQHLEMENEATKAHNTVASLVTCRAASERVNQALDALRAAVVDSKDSILNAINVHETEAEAADEVTTTAKARNAWRDLIQLLEPLTSQINSTTNSTNSHILNTSDQVSASSFLAECTQHSIATLDVSLDTIAASLEFKRRGLSSFPRIPDEVLGMIFQLAVEEERKKLRAEFPSTLASFKTLDDMRRTIPICPFTLAAVCQQWRNIALHTPKLWSYIRVYTLFRLHETKKKYRPSYCWVGKAAFEWSFRRAKGTPVELVIYQDSFQQLQTQPSIRSDASISTIYLVRVNPIPRWLPPCLHLSLFGGEGQALLWNINGSVVDFPPFPIGPKEISCTDVLPTFPAPLHSTTTFNFVSTKRYEMIDLNMLCAMLPNIKILQLRLLEVSAPSTHSTGARTWRSLTTLSVTSSALPWLAAIAPRWPSLPSLTTLILTDVFASFTPSKYQNIQYVVQTLGLLEIYDISSGADPSELRVFIDWMQCLHTVMLHRLSVQKTVKSLSITPANLIKKLIIEGTVLEGVTLQDYSAILGGSYNVSVDPNS